MNILYKICTYSLIVICFLYTTAFHADKISDITNYKKYNSLFASSGQPSKTQLQLLANSGVQQVIYLAFTDNSTAIANEDRLVKSMGMNYVHIPVDFDKPTTEDFQRFVAVMEQSRQLNTLLHCQVNFRASTFSFLYRVIYLKIPVREAKNALDGIWEPNDIWFDFLKTTLEHHSIDYKCESCDWGVHEFSDDH